MPDAAVQAFDDGMLAFIQRDYAGAAQSFEAAIAAQGPFDDAQYMLALAKLRLGAVEEARDLLGAVLEGSDNVMLRDYAATKLKRITSRAAVPAEVQARAATEPTVPDPTVPDRPETTPPGAPDASTP